MTNYQKNFTIFFVSTICCFVCLQLWRADVNWHKTYGPHPGHVRWESDTGIHGNMYVRDTTNAGPEVQKEVQTIMDCLNNNQHVKIENFPSHLQITKIELLDDK